MRRTPFDDLASHYIQWGENRMETELLVANFDNTTGADALLETLKDLQDDDFIELLDAVIVTKDLTGKVEVRQPLEVGPGKGAAFGALTGAVVGLIGGPAGVIVGFVSGAVTGGVTGAALEAGLPEEDIQTLAANELQPGQSALMVYYDQVWIDQIEQAVRDLGATIQHQVVVAERRAEREGAAAVRREKIDATFRSWQATIDQQRASLAALRQQTRTNLQADRDAVRQQIETANARLHEFYDNALHTLHVWQQQLDTEISLLEADAEQGTAETKAAIQQQLDSAKQSRQALRADVKATLTARLDTLKSEIENLRTQALNAEGEAKAKLNQRITELQANWDAEQRRLDQLDAAYGEAWDTMVNSIDEAIVTYEAAAREAEADYASAV
jgi:uncharacterized membrane protein